MRLLKIEKKQAWAKAKRAHHWEKIRKVRNEFQKLLQVKHNQFNADLPDILKKKPKRFWSFFRAKTKTKCLPSKICHEGVSATNPDDMAGMFNKYFDVASNNNTGVSSAVPDIDQYKNMYLSNILFTESDVLKVLSSLDGSKACGPDGVSPAVLKHCAK